MNPAAVLDDRQILRATYQQLSAEEVEVYQERAAIMEFEGGLPHDIAKREALWDTVRQRRYKRDNRRH